MRFARRVGVALLVSVSLGAPAASQESAPASGVAQAVAEVLALERQIEAALVQGDAAFLERAWADDFQFTHGDSWTSGGEPLAVNSKAAEIAAVGPGQFIARTLSSQHVEWHGDVAVTTGQISVQESRRRAEISTVQRVVSARVRLACGTLAAVISPNPTWSCAQGITKQVTLAAEGPKTESDCRAPAQTPSSSRGRRSP